MGFAGEVQGEGDGAEGVGGGWDGVGGGCGWVGVGGHGAEGGGGGGDGGEDVLWMSMKGEGSTHLDGGGVVENASESTSSVNVQEENLCLKEIKEKRKWRAIFAFGKREKGHEESEGEHLFIRRLRKATKPDAWFHES